MAIDVRAPIGKVFSRDELFSLRLEENPQLGKPGFLRAFERNIKEGKILRVGRDLYVVPEKSKAEYRHDLSPEAKKALDHLLFRYPKMPFSFFELIQFNEFVNHQIAHNAIIVSVGEGLEEYAFECLKERFPAVLLKPNRTECDRYWADGVIVVNHLVGEAPLSKADPHEGSLEKILVDTILDPLLTSLISASEWPAIFEDGFSRYAVNEDKLFRYARRRNGEQELLDFIKSHTGIQLYTRRQ